MPNYAQYYPVGALPSATADQRGRVLLLQTQGNADVAYMCRANGVGGYEWYTVMDTMAFSTGGGGAPTDAPYLTTVSVAGLSAEVVVGTAPGGELGGTWATPTVAGTHSGSAHHSNTLDHANTNDPTAGQKAGLAGTSGTPGDTNRYVTDGDSRNTNSRTPSSTLTHASTHAPNGADVPDIMLFKRAPASYTIPTGYSAFVFGNYVIGSAVVLTLTGTAILRVAA